MKRAQPITSGEWNRIARKHYRHIDGAEVVYRWNLYHWEIIGGPNDGERYETLNVAQYYATRSHRATP